MITIRMKRCLRWVFGALSIIMMVILICLGLYKYLKDEDIVNIQFKNFNDDETWFPAQFSQASQWHMYLILVPVESSSRDKSNGAEIS